jgi:hypothetical protein
MVETMEETTDVYSESRLVMKEVESKVGMLGERWVGN